MKKLLLFLFVATTALTGFAQDKLNEGFEGATFPPEGWTTYRADEYNGGTAIAAYKAKWIASTYGATATDRGSAYYSITGYTSGGNANANVCSSALNNLGGKINPSSWLITPKITVADGDYLHFMMGYNYAYNANANVVAAKKISFDIVVMTSPTDTIDCETLYTIVPSGLSNWSKISVNISKYAGRDVYIGFHDHGTPNTTPYVLNNMFIDDVAVNSTASSDLSIKSTSGLTSGSASTQALSATILNTGASVSSYKVCYQVNDNTPVVETVTTPIANMETVTHKFATDVVLPENGLESTVKVWCEADADLNQDNNSVTLTATIFEVASIPFATTEATLKTDLASTRNSLLQNVIRGWAFYETTASWVYTHWPNVTNSILYTTKSLTLKKGKIKVVPFCATTAEGIEMKVFLTKTQGTFGAAVASQELKATLDATNQAIDVEVPEDGNYIVGLRPATTTAGQQCSLWGFKVSEPYDDIAAVAVTSPAGTSILAQNDVTISASFINNSGKTLTDVPVSYQINEGTAVTEKIATINDGETIDYAFTAKADFTTSGIYNLKVWSSLASDADTSNDALYDTIASYTAKPFPYATSFENEEDKLIWTSVNINDDDTYWGIEANTASTKIAIDGTHVAFLNYSGANSQNDLFISPAITLTKGTAGRIAYYHTPSYSYDKTTKLTLYMSTSSDPDAILASGTKLLETTEATASYEYASVELPDVETGTYYFAFYGHDGKNPIVIDDVRINAASELAVCGLSSSLTSSSFDIQQPEITVSIKNCGVTTLTGGNLSYSLYLGNTATRTLLKTYTESYSDAIAPGATFNYTFKNLAEITAAGTYSFSASLTQPDDSDTKNNTYSCAGPTFYPTKTAPITYGFEDTDDNAALTLGGKWVCGTSTPYQGLRSLEHSGAAATDGDWAYLNRIYLEPGTYDFSFFWKTQTSATGDTYKQNLGVYIGEQASPAAMTTTLYEVTDTLNADHKATKVMTPLVITKAGNYYIGIKSTSTNSFGKTVVDQFEIKEPVEGSSLTPNTPYVADFANNESDWYHYYPTRTSSQWTAKTDGDATYMTTARTYSSITYLWTTPGLLESPAFSFKKGDLITTSFDYSLAAATGSTLDGESDLSLFIADKDMPDAFTTLIAKGTEDYLTTTADKGTATGKYEIPADGVYYFGFMPDSKISETFNLHSFELTLTGNSGINASAQNGKSVRFFLNEDNILNIIGDYTTVDIYTKSGYKVVTSTSGSTIDLSGLAKDMYIVKVVTNSDIVTDKILIN